MCAWEAGGVDDDPVRSWERRADDRDEYESRRAGHEGTGGRGWGGRPRVGRKGRVNRLHNYQLARHGGNGPWSSGRTDGSGRSSLGRPSFGGPLRFEDAPDEGREDESNLYDVEGRDGGDGDFDMWSFHGRTPGGRDRRRGGHKTYGSIADAALGARPSATAAANPYVGGGRVADAPGTPPKRRSWNPRLIGNAAAADRRPSWYGAGALGSGPSSDAPGMQNLGNTCYLSAR